MLLARMSLLRPANLEGTDCEVPVGREAGSFGSLLGQAND